MNTEPAYLDTERLILTPPTLGDAGTICDLVGAFEVARWLGRVPHPYSQDDAVAFLTDVAPRHAAFAIRRRSDGVFMGLVGLAPRDEGKAILGYWLGIPFWGKGYATEAARAVVRHGFDALGLTRISSGYLDGNAASANVLTKLGFRRTGTSEHWSVALARPILHHDMVLDAPAEARTSWTLRE